MSYSPFYILFLSMNIATLTYILGALFYGLPIPVYGVKKWGPRMISDAIYAGVWINIYGLIIVLANELQNLLGVNWSIFYTYLTNLEAQAFYLMFELKSIYYTLVNIKAAAAAPVFIPLLQFSSFISDIVFLLQFIIDIGEFVQNSFMILIAIGILLLSLPFRIGKGIGGSLISSSIVFYIGLPYLPIFMQNIYSPPTQLQYIPVSDLNVVIETIVGLVPSLVMAFIIIPIIYISILAGLSIGLGNAIGGSGGKIPFPIDLF
ncbi:hypothetical protein BFU36_02610 [Sulfolobus sp. A20]|uniref:DNA import protein CedA n=1 Tax=Sulfolobaceae TaxID=118883 RepID=UPI000845C031|nr:MULTISPECIES: DNA import protein CedA [unclassified Sulfolobus]TRM74147.1 hypothetical protein DJ523_05575 [Sulfolobus sp. E5]TRM74953.1 hypothetical protein DJ532_11555 [Sulfolobus sp. A20-N-F8]TRM75215.1 hypothetical protein DJ528_09580 [Sulfolobus sp. B5]TRM80473.1 hypothetical protein DJ524_07485 [Sulfolobus sp. D5]TRM87118.1 hypothetical protein DJ529_09530 [Sulfolobus sp. C3]TRM94865.1 hypothetical protein DJ526_01520 [Sulfolobus sp. A20-N-G8]TRN01784.1 hypothetical protein DJ530_05